MRPLICLILLFSLGNSGLIAQTIQILHKDKDTSLRGLSVVDNSIAWVSGSKGWTALSRDGGLTWEWKQIKGYENLDFRDIEGFSDTKAIIVSAGTPAVILLTDENTNL